MASPARPPKPGGIQHTSRPSDVVPLSPKPLPTSSVVPEVDDAFFQGRSLSELNAILENPQLLEAIYWAKHPLPIQYTQVLAEIEDEQQKLRIDLEKLSPEVLEKKFEAENSLIKTKHLQDEWEAVERSMYSALKPYTSDALYTRLQAAVSDSEKLSDSLVSSFLDAGPSPLNDDIHDFIKEYRQTRKIHHLRSERLARWKDGRVGGFR
ncbi:protein of unknown function [Taphrina deformans PYCC 5710]|uniref:VPS37 C-terminal domain-containing protein n=1 Tax=Taphrina deformans (strain PYCC 5710 / ATCC 11124 / CBS 356.35 / IMI 108563 / JCM 9778 / NBRC 8474) TaxID=1097556 RepID=R4XEP8_TAPDE|nr:protein of unknown function [Taphrina deformans PYCC 5710]|eukprot:CCG84251.1 protein of unknown function [Taphrina deformans PYCC 5710]